MNSEEEHRIREAALDLALNTDTARLTCANVAERAGVPLETVKEVCHSDEALIGFMLDPLTSNLDDRLRRLPIHQAPTADQRREILAAVLSAALDHPAQVALVVRVRTNPIIALDHRRADRFSYQAGVRLLGTEYDTDPDAMTRVNLASDLISLAVCSQRQDLSDPHQSDVLLNSALAALTPHRQPAEGPGPQGRRRWTDPEAPDIAQADQPPPS